MYKSLIVQLKKCSAISTIRMYTSTKCIDQKPAPAPQPPPPFETVFSFPFIKYIAMFNKFKVYHIYGASLIIPSSGVMELLGVLPDQTFLIASYIGVTGGVMLSLATLPFRNIIGFLYISEDNKHIKISSVDFWGKRKDRILSADDWFPLNDLPPKTMDALYLSPQLSDNTKYKLFVKFGNVLNSTKIGQVLE